MRDLPRMRGELVAPIFVRANSERCDKTMEWNTTEVSDSRVVVEVSCLCKVFTDPKRQEIRAVDGVSFTCHEGEIFGILGPNGAGKTTLLRMIATILSPTGGSARICGFDVVVQPDEVKKRIGFLSGSQRNRALLRKTIRDGEVADRATDAGDL
jgi:ABC-type glutathione transport system ATPase component